MRAFAGIIVAGALAGPALAQAPAGPQEANGYSRYELLAPGTAKFRIIYDITAVRTGATAFFNPIRKGSIASDESVVDLATGKPLKFAQVTGAQARESGLPNANLDNDYIRVELSRPVPADGGEQRLRIDKTYEDPKSYRVEGAEIVFDRPLGVKKNAVVLPPGYALVSSNYPSQVAQEADGRIRVSFYNVTPAEAPLKIRAAPVRMGVTATSAAARVSERAKQTRNIVYWLKDPTTHAFDLSHDYTEERAGVGRYVNVVRAGSTASNPSARNLDTGAVIVTRQLKGAAITAAGVTDPGLREVKADSEVVVFEFPPVAAGQSLRLRMSETYTDPGRYRLAGEELVFERTFGRPENAVVLPAGWVLTNSSAPATVSRTADGRTRLDFRNASSDELSVLITARRGAAQ